MRATEARWATPTAPADAEAQGRAIADALYDEEYPAAPQPISSPEMAVLVAAAAAGVSPLVAFCVERGPDSAAAARAVAAAARDHAWRLAVSMRGRNDAAEDLEIRARAELVAIAAIARGVYQPERTPPLGGPGLAWEDYDGALQVRTRALEDLAARAGR